MGAKAHRPQTSLLTSGAATLLGQHTDKSPIDNMDAFNTLTETLPDQQPPSPSPVHQLSGDPWFQKHGVKGFLDWKLLWEDVPPEKFCLGSSFPGYFVQRSPRSEARSLAKVQY